MEAENKRYSAAQQEFASRLEELTEACASEADASSERNLAIRVLTKDVVEAFNTYIRRAVVMYGSASEPVVRSVIRSEILPFLRAASGAVAVLNSEAIVSWCGTSSAPFKITSASLGAVQLALIELGQHLSEETRNSISAELLEIVDPCSSTPLLQPSEVFPSDPGHP